MYCLGVTKELTLMCTWTLLNVRGIRSIGESLGGDFLMHILDKSIVLIIYIVENSLGI